MKFFISLLIGMVIAIVLWVLVIIGEIHNPTISSQWVYDVLSAKYKIAKSIKEPKIILCGGSSVLFGLDSKMIKNAFDRPVVNMGVNAGLQTPLVLQTCKSVAKSGDIILLALEYPDLYEYNGKPNAQSISYILSHYPSFLLQLTPLEIVTFVWDIPLSRVIEGYQKTGGKPITFGPYGAHRIDGFGDETDTKRVPKEYIDGIKNEKSKVFDIANLDSSNIVWKKLQKFKKWADENGIKIVAIPVSMLKEKSYSHSSRYFALLKKRLDDIGIKMVGNPIDFFYSIKYFYNTIYHLNDKGRKIHTKRVIELLKNSNL